MKKNEGYIKVLVTFVIQYRGFNSIVSIFHKTITADGHFLFVFLFDFLWLRIVAAECVDCHLFDDHVIPGLVSALFIPADF